MIRINLLPQARKPVRAAAAAAPSPGSAQLWVMAYVLGAMVWIAGCIAIYFVYDAKLEEQNQQNAALTTQIEQLRTKSAQLDEARGRLAKSRELEDIVAELQKARTGPTRVLMELSKILSPPPRGGPTVDPEALEALRRENPLAGFNRGWDPRRLWITSFQETDGACEVKGVGRTNEDVAEFLRRLQISELFDQVTLQRTQSQEDTASGLTLIGFELTCAVVY